MNMDVITDYPDDARVWIYQADRAMTIGEAALVRKETEGFLQSWAAHGQELKATFSIKKNQFLIIAVDESFAQATGCSIDTSVALVRKLSDVLGINFLDRSVAIQKDNEVFRHPRTEIKGVVNEGVIDPDTLVFNNTMQKLGDWKRDWLLPAQDSWLKRYFN